MPSTRRPSSSEALDLSVSGSQLSVSKRPSSASPGKCFTRSVSVAGDRRVKRNTLSDVVAGSSRSSKNLRRSNSTTQVHQQASSTLSPDQGDDYLTLFDSSSDGRHKLSSLSKASPDGTTWNILDDQPRIFPPQLSPRSPDSPAGPKRREPGITLAASFTANNRSNKGGVGNSVTTILHNNYSEKPLTPKSSNQKPSFNNILKATANDEVTPENASVTRSQKNFSFSPSSVARSPASAQPGSPRTPPRRREVSEEEAERFIQQVNQAAVTIQRWYRRHVKKRHPPKEWEELTEEEAEEEEEDRPEQEQRTEEDRKQIREDQARSARAAAIKELQQRRARRDAEAELQRSRPAGGAGRRKPPRISITHRSPVSSAGDNSPVSPTGVRAKTSESNLSPPADLGELIFRAASPAPSNPRSSGEQENGAEEELVAEQPDRGNRRKSVCKEKPVVTRLVAVQVQDLQQRRTLRGAEGRRQGVAAGRKKVAEATRSPASPTSSGPASPADVKTQNTDSNANVVADVVELSFRAASPALSNGRAPQEVAHGPAAPSKTALAELLDTLKLLEEEPERLSEPQNPRHQKYAWIDEDGDSNSLTTDNLERHGQLSRHPALPHGGALLSEAKLQNIMSFLDEMEKSEQERPRSATSGSHREAVLSEEELAGAEQDGSAHGMKVKLELEEKKCTVHMLQAALNQQRALSARHVKEAQKELSRGFQLQKAQYEATIQRHLAFIDQLIGDKKALSERCEGVLAQLKQVDQKYTQKISQMQQQHELEIKKLKELMSATEKMRREKWIDEKTKKIKEITVKGLEPEIQKLISKHKQELKKLRTLHDAELQEADQRAAQRHALQGEELRQQLDRQKEEQCLREREAAKQRYDKQIQEEELALQQQRRRLYKEVAEEKERLAQMAARQRAELEDLRRQLEENSSLTGRVLREELDKTREEQERRHQVEMKTLQERLNVEKQTWEETFRKKEESGVLSRERQLKDELRRERDKEIEMAIWTLEEETSKEKEECERAADNRVKRLRDKYEAELRELQLSERAAQERLQELRRRQTEAQGQMDACQAQLRQREQELLDVTRTRDALEEERRGLAQVIRREFAERLVETEEENRRMQAEASEARAKLRLEVERVTRAKDDELAEVHLRVKSAILKKEETINNLRKQHEAALKRADHLEAMWEQQRKQLLRK